MEELALGDYFAILRRWKKLFLVVTLILAALSLIYTMRWSTYRATATVQIEPQEISSNATTPLGGGQNAMQALADQRISELEQKVMSTASLIDIITKFDLYAGARKSVPIADVADGMRKKVKLALLSGDMANPAAANKVSPDQLSAIAFTLSFDYNNPLLAQQVTNELVTRFLDQDLQERRAQAQETSAFLGNQITALEASMSDQEAKIADYQKTQGTSRPENLAFNQQAAATLTLNLQSLDGQITANEGQQGALRAQLAGIDPYSRVIADGQVLTTPSVQLKALQSQYATLTAQYGPEHPDVVKVKHQIEALQSQVGGGSTQRNQLKAQIEDVRTNLDAARKTYGPNHPDVVSLQHQLQKLEDQLVTSRATSTASGGFVSDADNPTYLQLVSQIQSVQEQHKALLEQRKSLQQQQEAYQKAIMANPEAAQEMERLTRDYDNAQLRYRELKEKKMAADMDEQMQQDRKGGRLTLLDPPELPLKTHPARLLILLGGLVVSVIGGSISILVAQILTQCVVGAHHLESIVGVAPLVVIPHIMTREERSRAPLKNAFRLLDRFIRPRLRSKPMTKGNRYG